MVDTGDIHFKNGWDAGRADAISEIERLQEIKKALSLQAAGLLSKADQQAKRIEELEKGNKFVGEVDAIVLASQGKHIFTDGQIDAAWIFNEDSSFECRSHGRAMLYSHFRIDACRKCGGAGYLKNGIPPLPHHERRNTCPDCNVHGWVIE